MTSREAAALEGVPWLLTAGMDVDGWGAVAPSASFEGGRVDADGEELLRFEPARPVGSWVATGILHGDAFRSPIIGTQLTAAFAEPDALRGSAGCNTYRATYSTDGGAIEISPAAATRKACAEPEGVMEQEAGFLEALASAARFRVDGATLELVRADGTAVVHLVRS